MEPLTVSQRTGPASPDPDRPASHRAGSCWHHSCRPFTERAAAESASRVCCMGCTSGLGVCSLAAGGGPAHGHLHLPVNCTPCAWVGHRSQRPDPAYADPQGAGTMRSGAPPAPPVCQADAPSVSPLSTAPFSHRRVREGASSRPANSFAPVSEAGVFLLLPTFPSKSNWCISDGNT